MIKISVHTRSVCIHECTLWCVRKYIEFLAVLNKKSVFRRVQGSLAELISLDALLVSRNILYCVCSNIYDYISTS